MIKKIAEKRLNRWCEGKYLDNPTFRGMRQSLMKSFDEIYLLDLHGSSLKKERSSDGSKDENVFDIRQGVAIGLFVKKKEQKEEEIAKVYYAEQWGLREDKYKWFLRNDKTTTEWRELKPNSPFYFFVPREETYLDIYEKYWKITDIMPKNSVGIVTARDKLTIQDSPEKVWEIVQDFSTLPEDIARGKYNLGKDVRDWKVSFAQNDLRKSGLKKELIVPILYRPFDVKYTYYTGHSRGFICMPRPEVMQHMMHENLGLCVPRQIFKGNFQHCFATEYITDLNLLQTANGQITFPLYLYPDKSKGKLLDEKASKPERTANFGDKFLQAVKEDLGTEPTPEEIFCYIYAVLYSPTYRKRYEEFLKVDFLRIPIPTDYELFKKLSEFGKELIELHLLKHPALQERDREIGFPKSGSNKVERVKYDEKTERVYFNKEQYFEGITKEVLEYQIGGYQVAEKYLKGRKGRVLPLEEIEHYMRVVKAIERTIEVQERIDDIFEE
jgi:predicted helicase